MPLQYHPTARMSWDFSRGARFSGAGSENANAQVRSHARRAPQVARRVNRQLGPNFWGGVQSGAWRQVIWGERLTAARAHADAGTLVTLRRVPTGTGTVDVSGTSSSRGWRVGPDEAALTVAESPVGCVPVAHRARPHTAAAAAGHSLGQARPGSTAFLQASTSSGLNAASAVGLLHSRGRGQALSNPGGPDFVSGGVPVRYCARRNAGDDIVKLAASAPPSPVRAAPRPAAAVVAAVAAARPRSAALPRGFSFTLGQSRAVVESARTTFAREAASRAAAQAAASGVRDDISHVRTGLCDAVARAALALVVATDGCGSPQTRLELLRLSGGGSSVSAGSRSVALAFAYRE